MPSRFGFSPSDVALNGGIWHITMRLMLQHRQWHMPLGLVSNPTVPYKQR
jgi:hypothetical protein